MKRRPIHPTKTKKGIFVKDIIQVVMRYPALHTYGIGLEPFRSIPEHFRLAAIDYARYMLAFELDEEIDSAHLFFSALGANTVPFKKHYQRTSYLLYMYKYWRRISGGSNVHVPPGAMIVAALIHKQYVLSYPKMGGDSMISIPLERRRIIEGYLQKNSDFKPWPASERTFRSHKNNRVDEVRNEPQRVDAIETIGE